MTRSFRRRLFAKFLVSLQYLLFFAGAVGIGIFVDSVAERWIYQFYGGYELDAASRNAPASLRGFAGYLYDRVTGVAHEPERKRDATERSRVPNQERPVTHGPIASLEIPRLNIKTVVQEGVDDSTLRLAAGHVPGTALPGETGNAAITAHRDTIFRGLKDIRKDDLITVRTPEGDYEYRVKSSEIVPPSELRVLEPHGGRELTLITCYPFAYIGHAPSRYVVHAEEINSDDSQPVFGPAGATP